MSGSGGYLVVEGINKRFGPMKAIDEVSFSLPKGQVLTLLGPSGCGKTTTLRAIAGFETIDSGRISIDGNAMTEPARGINVPPEKRNFGMVFQSYAIWPHMTVAENVAYGLHRSGLSRSQQRERVQRVLEMVGLAGQIDRQSTMLSGGQQQRVALARAIVYEPKILLFDEPLSNLDAKLRERMRLELRRLQSDLGITSVYVTHDQEEAMVVSDTVIVMNRGRIQQIAPAREIYDFPANRFVAEFIGATNIFDCTVGEFDATRANVRVDAKIGDKVQQLVARAHPGLKTGEAAAICVRHENASLTAPLAAQDRDDGVNHLAGRVVQCINMGSFLDITVLVNGADFRFRSSRVADAAAGQDVGIVFAREHCLCVPNTV